MAAGICCSSAPCDYEHFKGPDPDLMTELEALRAKEMRAIRGQSEAAAPDSGKASAFGSSVKGEGKQGLTDKHPYASFHWRAPYQHVVK